MRIALEAIPRSIKASTEKGLALKYVRLTRKLGGSPQVQDISFVKGQWVLWYWHPVQNIIEMQNALIDTSDKGDS